MRKPRLSLVVVAWVARACTDSATMGPHVRAFPGMPRRLDRLRD